MLNDSGRYGQYAMSNDELRAFCLTELQGVLASLRKDGRPFAIPLGYLFDGSAPGAPGPARRVAALDLDTDHWPGDGRHSGSDPIGAGAIDQFLAA